MSYPPTEAGAISNDSLFSDSVDFDAAEKPAGADENAAPQQENRNLPTDYQDDIAVSDEQERLNEQEEPAAPPPPPPPANGLMKPRQNGTALPKRWERIGVDVPSDDPDDEFDIATAEKPVYRDEEDPKPKTDFQHGEPDMEGDITNCFDEPGLLYRIVNKKEKTWAFYNDSTAFEVHVTCTFGKHSKLEALENTQLSRNDAGEWIAEVTVYPGETELFVKGFVNGFTSKLRAVPLSDDYFNERSKNQVQACIQDEMDAIRDVVGEDETDPEVILRACVENDIPFVDLAFPPAQSSIDTGAAKPFKQLPWARPRNYLKPELVDQIRLFRDGITPGDVNQGELGDCWLMCALATQAEHPKAIMAMFRHPKGADAARAERGIGAYRVTFNKHGLWRSVLVDDYLPVVANAPKFAHSEDPCEMWSSVLEKAFAKLHRSYAMIQSGDPVHALTDMTGCPSMRFDEPFADAQANPNGAASIELFERWHRWDQAGYQMIITTPGKAPAITPGSHNVPDFSEEPELARLMQGTGLLPGHAYTVLSVQDFPDEGVKLVAVRNPWTNDSDAWTGNWSSQSELWDQYPRIADTCRFDPNDALTVWMTWEDVLQYFAGGGVHFNVSNSWDYRVPITFADCRPSVVFEITAEADAQVCLTLSNIDHRGMHAEERGAAEVDPNSSDYPPIMLSLCAPTDDQDDVYKVVYNTSADTTQPSDSKWTFLQAREISMVVKLEAGRRYLLVPRVMESDDTVGGGNGGEDYESRVDPLHFINKYDRVFPDQAGGDKKEVPVTVGFRVGEQLGNGAVNVTLKKLPGSNSVFENFPKFPADDIEEVEDLYYQVKEPTKGYADERMGNMLN